ncbi:hypothetical protein [Paenibacillus sonchi]|uniref:hypothetical protein n=1 Tax=Paenibacillus sonchi TaxID=373687 RepID=UPI001E5A1A15|nr:hypothetical protein [Paenibacillus sonchi]MCE3203441.1 hypothetical protein [Paenibacillus sonchi]
MLSREKVINHLMEHCSDTNSEKDRFIKDMLVLIEFGNFEPDDDELEPAEEFY